MGLPLHAKNEGLQPPGYALQSAPTADQTIYDFTPIQTLLNQAIADKKLPGAVVLIGHNNQIAFHQAFGNRKLAGEPGSHGELEAEPMTEDTLFDMASLTKCLATATAIMQLYEAGKLTFDAPLEQYLPTFNPVVGGKKDPDRTKVTIRTLLTHYSGEAPDVDLKDPWGLAAPDKAEGIRRALTTPLRSTPGQTFVYSDINFILLGHLVETLSGQPEDGYVKEHIFSPLKMTMTTYHSFDKACGPHRTSGSALELHLAPHTFYDMRCIPEPGDWQSLSIANTAPTAHDDESKANPTLNPDFDHLLRGTVHDPTTRRMGGVAGHAGVFSTAHDISLYAQALLNKLTRNTGPFPLKQSTLKLMTQPEQPPTAQPGATIFTPDGQPTKGIATRGFGWDINTAFSRPRGTIFPTAGAGRLASFGHTGFTGTSLWMDPTSNTYVILLANAIHPRGGVPITPLRGQLATAAAQALGVCPPSTICDIEVPSARNQVDVVAPAVPPGIPQIPPSAPPSAASSPKVGRTTKEPQPQTPGAPSLAPSAKGGVSSTLTGIDVLEQTHYATLTEAATRHQNHLNLAILTNAAGLDSQGRRTIDQIATQAPKNIHLTTLFAAEHGLSAKQDTSSIAAEFDQATNLPITSLYGPKPTDRRPSHDQLKNLDAVLIDLQDVGNRFWTFDTAMAYFLEASATERTQYRHDLEIIVLDHPNPTSGTDFAVQGPLSDPGRQSYIDYTPLPARHGLTIGELARYDNAEATPTTAPTEIFAENQTRPMSEQHPGSDPLRVPVHNLAPTRKGIGAHLTIVPLQHWTRAQYLDQTGIPWTPPSPNLRTLTAATLYPGIGLFETTNLSVGRGTATPFEHFGAPYLVPADMLACLTPRRIPGIQFSATTLTIAETPDRYPYHGQTIPGLHLTLTDRTVLDAPELAIEIMTCAHRLYPTQFNLDRSLRILANADTLAALERGDDPRDIAASWQPALQAFRKRRSPYLLYPDSH